MTLLPSLVHSPVDVILIRDRKMRIFSRKSFEIYETLMPCTYPDGIKKILTHIFENVCTTIGAGSFVSEQQLIIKILSRSAGCRM